MTTLRLQTTLRCAACIEAITPLLDAEPTIEKWSADVSTPDKVLTVEGDGVTISRVTDLLDQKGYRVIRSLPEEQRASRPIPATTNNSEQQSPTSYYPLVLILLYLVGVVAVTEIIAPGFELQRSMRHFMAGFFLVFSFFKLLDLPAFAVSYSSYDILARRWLWYGYAYPFIELALGLAYLANFWPVVTNAATVVVMAVSTIGVIQSLVSRRKIRCACLGAVFNLPMSVVTLSEDLLMVLMAAGALGASHS
jgi:hypothetical protein